MTESINWKEIKSSDENMFDTVRQVIKHPKAQYPSDQIIFSKKGNDRKYKLTFDWQDENICGITIYKQE